MTIHSCSLYWKQRNFKVFYVRDTRPQSNYFKDGEKLKELKEIVKELDNKGDVN